MQTIRVAIDAMGGDYGPHFAVEAARSLCLEFPEFHPILFLQDGVALPQGIEHLDIRFCPDIVLMSDKPSEVLRSQKSTTMLAAINALHSSQADVCLSSGNSGALMALSKQQLGMLEGFTRPVIAGFLPANRQGRKALWLDLGANLDCSADLLLQFARLGETLMAALDRKNVKTALLNIGVEQNKGNVLVQQANQLFQNKLNNYVGFVEASMMFDHLADVVVADGMMGNIALKASEAALDHILALLPEQQQIELRERLSPEYNSGAYLLGLKGLVVKTHGNSELHAWRSSLEFAIEGVKKGLVKAAFNK